MYLLKRNIFLARLSRAVSKWIGYKRWCIFFFFFSFESFIYLLNSYFVSCPLCFLCVELSPTCHICIIASSPQLKRCVATTKRDSCQIQHLPACFRFLYVLFSLSHFGDRIFLKEWVACIVHNLCFLYCVVRVHEVQDEILYTGRAWRGFTNFRACKNFVPFYITNCILWG
jgi:hypothetical protein